MITFEHVTKIFADRQIALADVTFNLPSGSTIGLLGANGSGKSTLLRIALGLISPTAGAVTVMEGRMHPGAKGLRQRIGFLSDAPAFPRDTTAIGYLGLVGRCFGLEHQELHARLGSLLRAVGLMDDAGRKISSYSTGMRTRLGIAASLMNDPELLVWDEPTAGLDPISRRQTLDLLEQFRGRKTVVLSSHILGDIDRVCDRLLVLNQGQLLFNGTRAELESLLPKSLLEALETMFGREPMLPDPGRVRIELGRDEVVGEVIERVLGLARETETTVVAVNSTDRQLEDAYLKLITEDQFRGFLRAKGT
jgi:ABC-2 type transport system ATP-binding protein